MSDSLLMPLHNIERPVIQDGGEILGGVLLSRAAIVADVDENPAPFKAVIDRIDERMHGRNLSFDADPQKNPYALEDAFELILLAINFSMPFNPTVYKGILSAEAQARGKERLTSEDQIGLSRFMGKGGNCHPHTLLSLVTLRLLQVRGDFEGVLHLDIQPDPDGSRDDHMEVSLHGVGQSIFRFSQDGS